MDHILGLKCSLCGREYGLNEIEYVCPKHGDMGNVDVVYDMRRVARQVSKRKLADDRDYSIWRYRALLPIEPDSPALPLQIGWTPLYRSKQLGDSLEMPNLYIKDDGRNPTASFKDRASAIAVVKVRELGRELDPFWVNDPAKCEVVYALPGVPPPAPPPLPPPPPTPEPTGLASPNWLVWVPTGCLAVRDGDYSPADGTTVYSDTKHGDWVKIADCTEPTPFAPQGSLINQRWTKE